MLRNQSIVIVWPRKRTRRRKKKKILVNYLVSEAYSGGRTGRKKKGKLEKRDKKTTKWNLAVWSGEDTGFQPGAAGVLRYENRYKKVRDWYKKSRYECPEAPHPVSAPVFSGEAYMSKLYNIIYHDFPKRKKKYAKTNLRFDCRTKSFV